MYKSMNLGKLAVLVVDDSRVARIVVKNLLLELGLDDIAEAEDGAAALVKLRDFDADLVLCDLNMTPLDGIEFTRLLRNAPDSPNPFVPVIMLTAEATKAQIANALKAGVNDFLSKPARTPVLRAHIAALFRHPLVYVREGGALRPERIATGGRKRSAAQAAGSGEPGAMPQRNAAIA